MYPKSKNPPKTLKILGVDCNLDERISSNQSSNFWQSNQKEVPMNLSVSIREQLAVVYNPHLKQSYTPGWTLRVEWWNGYNNRTFVVSRLCDDIESAERDILNQLSRLVEGVRTIQTFLTLSVLPINLVQK